MDEKSSRWNWRSIVALTLAIVAVGLSVEYAVTTARQYGFLPLTRNKPVVSRLIDWVKGPSSFHQPMSIPETRGNIVPVEPGAQKKAGEKRVIPAGPGKEVVIEIDSRGMESRAMKSTGIPITVDELPKVNLEKIHGMKEMRKDLPKMTIAGVLKTYGALNGIGSPGYEEGLIAVQLFAFYASTGDIYGEGWFQTAAFYATIARQKGSRDILVEAITGAFHLLINDITTGYLSRECLNEVLGLQSSAYPPAVKLSAGLAALPYLAKFVDNQADWGMKPDDERHYISYFLDAAVIQVEEMARQGVRASAVHYYARAYLAQTTINGRRQGDRVEMLSPQSFTGGKREDYEKLFAAALTRAKASGEVADLLKAEYLIDLAWDARGSGWASDVTGEGARKMAEYLDQAEELLIKAGEKYPENISVPTLMLTVGLGQGMSKWRMDEWFQKALAIDPAYQPAYISKMLFLQPKWYGSGQEVMDFAAECLHSGNWDDGIPMVFIIGVDMLAGNTPDFYKRYDRERNLVDGTYREYLRRHPESLETRTRYLMFSLSTNDWSVVKYQLAQLGNYWDMSQIDLWRYSEIVDEAAKH